MIGIKVVLEYLDKIGLSRRTTTTRSGFRTTGLSSSSAANYQDKIGLESMVVSMDHYMMEAFAVIGQGMG